MLSVSLIVSIHALPTVLHTVCNICFHYFTWENAKIANFPFDTLWKGCSSRITGDLNVILESDRTNELCSLGLNPSRKMFRKM